MRKPQWWPFGRRPRQRMTIGARLPQADPRLPEPTVTDPLPSDVEFEDQAIQAGADALQVTLSRESRASGAFQAIIGSQAFANIYLSKLQPGLPGASQYSPAAMEAALDEAGRLARVAVLAFERHNPERF